ncbi:MAG: hypothetical protein IPF57_17775 [Gammaproteobacteria bacterium]|nr:hypothetical protein [Gammaproteobacteria bacterium]
MHDFFRNRVGPGLEFSIAFGFPNSRHFSLGEKLKLYRATDKILIAKWPALQGRSCLHGARHFRATDLPLVDRFWSDMAVDCVEHAVGCRDSSWFRYRYLDKPGNHYIVMLVTRRVSRRPVGVLVMIARADDEAELLDVVAPRSAFTALIHVARITAHRLGKRRLFSWMTPSALSWFEGSAPETESTDVVVPGGLVNDDELARTVIDKWWLMGGDTDFR